MKKIKLDEKILCSAVFDANRVNYKMLKSKKEKIFLALYYIIMICISVFTIDIYNVSTYSFMDEYVCRILGMKIFEMSVYNDGEKYTSLREDNLIIVICVFVAVVVLPYIIAGIIKLITKLINKYAEGISSVCELYLTETQVCGVLKTLFGEKQLRVPLEKLDNISIRNSFVDKIIGGKKLCILSNSGVVRFPYVQNSEEFMQATFEQLEKRKKTSNSQHTVVNEKKDSTDDLKKYKELFDSGVITQEEFNAKKKQILGL